MTLAFENAGINPRREAQLRAFTLELLAMQMRFIRFADEAIPAYLAGFEAGVLR